MAFPQKKIRTCEWCGKPLKGYQKKFCSNSHSARFRFASDFEREMRKRKIQQGIVPQEDGSTDVFIYGLLDPRNHLIYYIGQSQKPNKRFVGHMTNTHYSRGQNPLYDWIFDLLEDDLEPIMVILQAVSKERAWLVEKGWIQQGLEHKWPLLNRNGRN